MDKGVRDCGGCLAARIKKRRLHRAAFWQGVKLLCPDLVYDKRII